MHLHYRYNALQAAAGSALRVVVNGLLVSEIPLLPGADFVEGQRAILVPVADLRPFGNTVLFNFDFIPANRAATQNPASAALKGEVLCNSTIDLQDLGLWTGCRTWSCLPMPGFRSRNWPIWPRPRWCCRPFRARKKWLFIFT